MKKKITDEVAQIDEQITAEQAVITGLEKNLPRALAETRQAEEAQRSLAYQALAQSDAQACADLSQAEDTLTRLQARMKSTEIALDTARTKLATLQDQRAEMYRRAKRKELDAEIALTIDAGKTVEEGLTALLLAVESVKRQVAKMESLALECGEPSDKYRKVLRALWRGFEQRMNLQPPWLERRFRELYKMPIQEVFEAHLKGASQDEHRDEEERKNVA